MQGNGEEKTHSSPAHQREAPSRCLDLQPEQGHLHLPTRPLLIFRFTSASNTPSRPRNVPVSFTPNTDRVITRRRRVEAVCYIHNDSHKYLDSALFERFRCANSWRPICQSANFAARATSKAKEAILTAVPSVISFMKIGVFSRAPPPGRQLEDPPCSGVLSRPARSCSVSQHSSIAAGWASLRRKFGL